MKFKRRHERGGDIEIPLTSLTDIMFLLLIFFMVTTTFQASSGIQVKLPASSAQMPEEKVERLVISIKADGRIFVDESVVEEGGLEGIFKNTAEKNPETLVVIRADKDVSHGRVVQVMDSARRMGLTKIAIATVQKAIR